MGIDNSGSTGDIGSYFFLLKIYLNNIFLYFLKVVFNIKILKYKKII